MGFFYFDFYNNDVFLVFDDYFDDELKNIDSSIIILGDGFLIFFSGLKKSFLL